MKIAAGIALIVLGLLIIAFFYLGVMFGSETGVWPPWATEGCIVGAALAAAGVGLIVWRFI